MTIIIALLLLASVGLNVWLLARSRRLNENLRLSYEEQERRSRRLNENLRLSYEEQERCHQQLFMQRQEAGEIQAEMRINHRADEEAWVDRMEGLREQVALTRRALVVQVARQEGVPLAEIT